MENQQTVPQSIQRSVLEAMDGTGDTKTHWDPANPAEVAAARASFDALKKKGYVAYRLSSDGTTGEQLDAFDPQAGRILMRPAMQGG